MPAQDLHGLAHFHGLRRGRPRLQPYGRGLSHLSRRRARHACSQLLAADPEFGLAHVLKGYFSCWGSTQPTVPAAREALEASRRLSASATRAASRRTSPRWRIGWRATSTPRLPPGSRSSAEHPLDVLAFRLHHFLAFWYGRPQAMAAQADATMRALEPRACRLAGAARLPLLRARGARQLRRRRGCRARGHRPRPWRPVGRARRRRTSWRCRGGPEEGIAWLARLEPHWEAATTSSTICGGTAASTISSAASSRKCWSSTTSSFRNLASPLTAGSARHLHRRPERRLHAVPAGAAGHRRGRALGRAGRQGRGAHRRLPLHVHPAALDDGARRRRRW